MDLVPSSFSPLWPFDLLGVRLVLGALLGLVTGSFLTMLSYRLPRGLPWIGGRSFCPSCKTPLSGRDLVPLLSWLLHKGRCRHCGARVSVRYPLIEGGMACAFAAAFGVVGVQLWLAPILIFLGAVGYALILYLEKGS